MVRILLVLGISLLPVQAQWPDFRGPTRDGQAPGVRVPLRWSEKDNVTWKVAVRGRGWSSPVVGEERVWLTSATEKGHELFVLAVDAKTGRELVARTLWRIEKPEGRNKLNSYASPSPVVETGRVYVHFGTNGTACLDATDGKTLWERRDIHCDHKEGPGSSPVLFGDLLFLNMDGTDVQYVIALDKRTGRTRWKRDRDAQLDKHPADRRKAYGTPLLLAADGRTQLVSPGAHATMAYDPKTGRELWRLRYRGFSQVSRPVAGHGLLFLNTGFMRPQILAVKLGGAGDVTDSHVVWSHSRSAPNLPSPVLAGDHLYAVSDGGVIQCLAARTGDVLWHHRLSGEHTASPVHADGRLYFFDREGRCEVLAPGPKYRRLAVNELDDGCMASPAVIDGALILRTRTHLYRIDEPR